MMCSEDGEPRDEATLIEASNDGFYAEVCVTGGYMCVRSSCIQFNYHITTSI